MGAPVPLLIRCSFECSTSVGHLLIEFRKQLFSDRHRLSSGDYRCFGAGCLGAVVFRVAVAFLAALAGFLAAAAAFGRPVKSMLLILTGSYGLLSRGSASLRASCRPRSTLSGVHCPKIVCRPSRCGVGTSVMKNCEPFVPGPEFAMASRPATSNLRSGENSSSKL